MCSSVSRSILRAFFLMDMTDSPTSMLPWTFPFWIWNQQISEHDGRVSGWVCFCSQLRWAQGKLELTYAKWVTTFFLIKRKQLNAKDSWICHNCTSISACDNDHLTLVWAQLVMSHLPNSSELSFYLLHKAMPRIPKNNWSQLLNRDPEHPRISWMTAAGADRGSWAQRSGISQPLVLAVLGWART